MENESKNKRRNEYFTIIGESNSVYEPLVDEVVFLEEKLEELRKLPFLIHKPDDPTKQKATPAAKQYKEFLQQYANCFKILIRLNDDGDGKQESPLRQFAKLRLEKYGYKQ